MGLSASNLDSKAWNRLFCLDKAKAYLFLQSELFSDLIQKDLKDMHLRS